MNTHSLRFQLITWYAGLQALVFLAVGAVGYLGLDRYLSETVKQTLSKRAQQISSTLTADADKGDAFILQDITTHYAPEINDRFLRVTRNGSLLYASGAPKDGSFDPSKIAFVPQPLNQSSFREEVTPGDRRVLIYALPFTFDGQSFVIESGVSNRQVQSPLNGLIVTLVVGLPIVLVVAVGSGYVLINRALLPVDSITKSAERITSHNLSERLPVPLTGDEIERLSLALNNMISRLEEAFQYTRRFAADASHELRTPLTILHCDLEAAIQTPRLPAEVAESIGSALAETERLTRIVEGLLAISRADAGEPAVGPTKLDLAELTFATVDQMRLLAEDKGIGLEFRATKAVEVNGEAARLKQVVVNLLDNAIKYTPERGTILVNVCGNGSKATLEISDSGMGISADALPHIFERFYRADKARSRKDGGAGLGLSIVESICAAHGGQVSVTTVEGQGSCFRVELPLANGGPS